MKYLIGLTPEEAAKTRTRIAAESKGCAGHITEYWFAVIKHYLEDKWGLCIPEDQEDLLTPEEIASLKTWEYLDSDGWWPPSEP